MVAILYPTFYPIELSSILMKVSRNHLDQNNNFIQIKFDLIILSK